MSGRDGRRKSQPSRKGNTSSTPARQGPCQETHLQFLICYSEKLKTISRGTQLEQMVLILHFLQAAALPLLLTHLPSVGIQWWEHDAKRRSRALPQCQSNPLNSHPNLPGMGCDQALLLAPRHSCQVTSANTS